VSKLDLGLQEFAGGFFGSYRVIKGLRGWLDLLAGFRYTYLDEHLRLQANNMAIGAASTRLVDDFAQQLVTPGSQLRTIVVTWRTGSHRANFLGLEWRLVIVAEFQV
jgi:hypothetical protein